MPPTPLPVPIICPQVKRLFIHFFYGPFERGKERNHGKKKNYLFHKGQDTFFRFFYPL